MSDATENPLTTFETWYQKALHLNLKEHAAVALATADRSGRPTVRMVLMKEYGDRGFVFYTNYKSAKASDMEENPQAGLCFYWDSLEIQIRVEGPVERLTVAESDAYFALRPRQSQIGAWASAQSQVMAHKTDLAKSVAATALNFGIEKIPRPPHWGGYSLKPSRFEFWRGHTFRLHDRFEFVKKDGVWQKNWLFP